MTYTYLLFDADDTLFDFHKSSENAFLVAMKENGVAADLTLYDRYAAINLALWKRFEKGEISKEELLVKRFRDFFEDAALIGDPDRVNTAYKAELAKQNILLPDALRVVKELSRRGYRLFLITNGDAKIQHSRLQNSPITPYLEKLFISEEIGHQKPSKAFFDAVKNGIDGFDPTRALVIGDSESSDIQGANNAKIDACYFSPSDKPLPDGITAKYRITRLDDLLTLLP